MLADWYFCAAYRLTITQTTHYLDVMEILRSPSTDAHQLGAAVDRLRRAELALRLHALRPLLSAAHRRSDDAPAHLMQALSEFCIDLAASVGHETDGAGGDASVALARLLEESATGLPPDLGERLRDALAYLPPANQRASRDPVPAYQDVSDVGLEIVGLTLLDLLAEEDQGVAAAICLGERRMTVVDDALSNAFGRLPLILAADAVIRSSAGESAGEVRRVLDSVGHGAADLEPDLLRVLADSWFGAQIDHRGISSRLVEQEIAGGWLFRLWAGGAPDLSALEQRRAVRDRLGAQAGPGDAALSTVLWQQTLWDLMAAHWPEETVRLSRLWWGPPDDRPLTATDSPAVLVPLPDRDTEDDHARDVADAGRWLGGPAALRWPSNHRPSTPAVLVADRPWDGGSPADTARAEGRDPSAVCSPWLRRKNDNYYVGEVAQKDRAAKSWYPAADEHAPLLALMATTATAVRLLRLIIPRLPDPRDADPEMASAGRPDDHLVALLFHARDVLADSRFRFFLADLRTGRPRPKDLPPVSSSMCGLMWHVQRTVDRVGKATYPEVTPAVIARLLLEGDGRVLKGELGPRKNEQWARLFRRPALQGAEHWIEESSAGAWRADRAAGRRQSWFDDYDGQVAEARRVLATAADRLSFDPGSARPSMQILRRNYPDANAVLDTDWIPNLPDMLAKFERDEKEAARKNREPNNQLRDRVLLAADPYPLAVWREHDCEVEILARSKAPRMAMRTLRLAALLREATPGDPADTPEWVTSWLDLMVRINEPWQWARQIRGAALDFFDIRRPSAVEPARSAADERLRQVLEVVVDATVEFSVGAPRYYQRLLQALGSADGPLPAEGMNRLRLRAVNTISASRAARLGRAGLAEGPWGLLAAKEAHDAIDREFRILVAGVARSTLTWNKTETLGRALVRNWRAAMLSPVGRLLIVPGYSRGQAQTAATAQTDPRVVRAQVHDRYQGTDAVLLAGQKPGVGDDGAKVKDLFALTPSARARQLETWRGSRVPRRVFGVVCAVGHEAGQAVLSVNWGAGEPVEVIDTDDHGRTVGDLCLLRVRWDADHERWAQSERARTTAAGRADPEPDEIRAAWVSAELAVPHMGTGLRVLVDGVPGYVLDRQGGTQSARGPWDPDLSRELTGRWDGDPVVETLARWDADAGCWLPADRTLIELIADDLPYEGPDSCRATVLTYVGPGRPDRLQEAGGHRFTTTPGRSYLLHTQDWASFADVTELLDRAGAGLLLYVGLAAGPDPVLALLDAPPEGAQHRWPGLARQGSHDTRNVDWVVLFSDDDADWAAELRDDGWTADVSHARGYPAGAGFPARVTVTGLDASPGVRFRRHAFRPDPWDAANARLGIVTGTLLQPDRLVRPHSPDKERKERFEAYWDDPRDGVFPLRRILGGREIRRSFVHAVVDTAAGDPMTVAIERDSLLFARLQGRESTPPKVKVLRAPVRQAGAAGASPAARLTADELATRLRPVATELPDVVRGVVSGVYLDGERKIDRYDVWVDLGDGSPPRTGTLPAGCIAGRIVPRGMLGETFHGASTPDGWVFAFQERQAFAVALYNHTTKDDVPDGQCLFLGECDMQRERVALYARPDQADVYVVRRRPAGRPLGVGATVAQRLGHGVRRGGESSRVLVLDRGIEIVGDTPATSPVPGVVGEVRLHAWFERDGLVSVRRELVVRAGAASASTGSGRHAVDPWQEILEQLADGEVVERLGRLENAQLRLPGLSVPLAPDDAPYVAGPTYSTVNVRARIQQAPAGAGEGLTASTRHASPYSAAEFALAIAGVAEGTEQPRCVLGRDVFYVGSEEAGGQTWHRFEWGHGYTVLLGPDELTVGDHRTSDEQAFPMFHGDRLARADFRVSPDGRTVMNILPEDVEIQTAGKVALEAGERSRIVHRVMVKVDTERRRVTIRRVYVSRMATSDRGDSSESRPIAALLDDASVERVLTIVARQTRSLDLSALEILARFDHESYQSSRGRTRLFSHVGCRFVASTDRTTTGVGAGERLFMVAGDIGRTSNDTFVDFRLPDEVLADPDEPPLTVRVLRREFSWREYLLPQLFDEGRKSYYSGKAVKLVRVRYDKRTRRWSGDLTSAPARPGKSLVSAVTHTGGRLFATLGDDGGKTVEVRPGINYYLPRVDGPRAAQEAGRGALVRLAVRDGQLRLDLAAWPDRTYVDAQGRPAIVLPKGRLWTTPGLAGGEGMWTVAGLPAISTTASADHGRVLLYSRHPKIALLTAENGRTRVGPPSDVPIRAAFLDTAGDEAKAVTVAPIRGQVPGGSSGRPGPASFQIPWAFLSFADTDREDVRRACQQTWRYHDTVTWHWSGEPHKGAPQDIDDRTVENEPVFFDEASGLWTLRYRLDRIRSFGLPATAITERRLDRGVTPHADSYTVAGPAVEPDGRHAHGIWVELGPGRVAELGGPLLVGTNGARLDDLSWNAFGPGDRVELGYVLGDVAEPRRLRLLSWSPGPRSALLPANPPAGKPGGVGRAILPVDRVDRRCGGLRLGAGEYTLTYPIGEAMPRLREGQNVWLDDANSVVVYDGRPLVQDNTALLGVAGDGSLRLLGLPWLKVEFPSDAGGDWLLGLLAGGGGAEALTSLGGVIPVTIDGMEGETVTVSRRRQPSSRWAVGRLLMCAAVGVLGQDLIVRSGGAYHRVAATTVVPGAPPAVTVLAARKLAERRQFVWLHIETRDEQDARGRRARVPVARIPDVPKPAPYEDEFEAQLIDVLGDEDQPKGVLLRAMHDQGFRWMPVVEASWVDRPTVAELRDCLPTAGGLVRVRQAASDGTVSAVRTRALIRFRRALRLGSEMRVEPVTGTGVDTGAGHRVVARIQPEGVLIRLTGVRAELTTAEPILAEVSSLDGDGIGAVLAGSRTHPVDLPFRLASGTALSALAENDRIVANYRTWSRVGLTRVDDADELADVSSPAQVEERLIRLAERVLYRHGEPDFGLAGPQVRRTLSTWLSLQGDAAFNLRPGLELELAPALTACLVMAELGGTDSLLARGAVLFTQQIGRRAVRSLHVEPIVRHWLPTARRQSPPGAPALTARLADLTLPAEMDQGQLRAARWFGHGVLGRVDDGGAPHPLAPVARAVLAAVGDLEPGLDLAAGAPLLSTLARLGRALLAPDGDPVAQLSLIPGQIGDLRGVLSSVLEMPLVLLPLRDNLPMVQRRLATEVRSALQ
ncbi:hypothetical protein [Frankia sp. CiP3]|uniref:hypothetical protein n=1 Tax=Frankia sp. CiP3 TaxID=2880971 RepID=UPI001EF4F02F|nr:hypothetical protein [Frankia sp. CiP3]